MSRSKSSFADHFSNVAESYASSRPDYPQELFGYLAGISPARRRAWDCATGNGQAARGLAAWFHEVVATDASAKQIEQAVSHPRVRYGVARAEESGLEPESVDCVTVAQSLHWFDIPAFWVEARRVLVPRGIVAVWCYDLLEVDAAVDAVLGRYYREIVGPYWPPERALVERGYRDVPFPFEAERAPELLLEKNWTLDALVRYLGTWSATQRYVAARREDPVGRVIDDLRRAWGPVERARRIVWPLGLRLGRKEKP
jgi:SAM-dependent methyltransferase